MKNKQSFLRLYKLLKILTLITLIFSIYILIPDKLFYLLYIDNRNSKKVSILFKKKPSIYLNIGYLNFYNFIKNDRNNCFNPYFINYKYLYYHSLYHHNLYWLKLKEVLKFNFEPENDFC